LIFPDFLNHPAPVKDNQDVYRFKSRAVRNVQEVGKLFFEDEPAPSAMLFEMLKAAPRNCSAKRYNFRRSNSSEMSNKSSAISMDSFQISRFSNLNLVIMNKGIGAKCKGLG
jgi:hypothetical protein